MWTKAIGATSLCAALLGCSAAPSVVARDYHTGKLTVCGSQTSNEDFQKKAVQVCGPTPPTLIGCVSNVKYPSVGIQGEMTVIGNCCDYECAVASTEPPAPK